tara:strand:- start:12649 stop:14064 length:1416 start_codon:yes stop_codon:yes gene_type:complete
MLNLKQDFQKLPSHFYREVELGGFTAPQLLLLNEELCLELGIDLSNLSQEEISQYFTGNKLFQNSKPIATAYAGHQFGYFNPQLGDGRAALLGEVEYQNQLYEVQLKGSGPTAFSRRGDGMSSLGPVIREFLVSEAMNKLSVPTTRALAACLTGDPVYRESELAGGVFTRVATSHIRIGTFQYFFSLNDFDAIKHLTDFCINRHYPHIENNEHKYLEFLKSVFKKQAQLVAKWMSLGFIHGVMNTDNMTISGETIDYGPCAFMDQFQMDKSYSYVDREGRYAFSNQPKILQWNLARLADCFLSLVDTDQEKSLAILNEELSKISGYFQESYELEMSKKLGFQSVPNNFSILLNQLINTLDTTKSDYTNFFLSLEKDEDNSFTKEWKKVLSSEDITTEEAIRRMAETNPAVIPRNHKVEEVIKKSYQGDFEPFKKFHEILKDPFDRDHLVQNSDFCKPPTKEQVVQNTFCGT